MTRYFITILAFIMSCSTKHSHNAIQNDKFKLPLIIQNENIDTAKPFNAEFIKEVNPQLMGKFKFGDTLDFAKPQKEQMSKEEYLWEVQTAFNSDSLSSDGLQIISDYKTSIVHSEFDIRKHLYFPIYVVNETNETKVFFGADNYGYAIQEAVSTSNPNIWYPIESRASEMGCERHFRKKIHPKEFLVFLLPKYSGSDITSMRIRFQIGESVFISKTFIGIINPKQFEIKKDSWVYRSLKSKSESANWFFYGGRIKKDSD